VSLRAPLTLDDMTARTEPRDQWFGADAELGQCWCATGRGVRLCRGGYARMDVRVRGLGWGTRRLSMHIVAWLLDHLGPLSRDDLWLAYSEIRASGLQFDHKCSEPSCIRPSHLIPLVTQSENIRAGKERDYLRAIARGQVEHYEDDPALIEF
jgi:hypothetical protein